MSLLYMLLIGAAAGWLAGQFARGRDFGLLRNIIIGVIGSFLGGAVFRLVGFAAVGPLGELITATVGALLLLWLLQQFGRPVK
jgi:uncharacterized membrane protein YeaQ/YmgE (transglycosylase-associated protein family)